MSAHHTRPARVRLVYNIVNWVVFYARYVLCTSLGQNNISQVFCWSQTCVPFQTWRWAALTCVTDSMKQSPFRKAKTSSTLSWSRKPLLFLWNPLVHWLVQRCRHRSLLHDTRIQPSVFWLPTVILYCHVSVATKTYLTNLNSSYILHIPLSFDSNKITLF
jgi:hypothetical protein